MVLLIVAFIISLIPCLAIFFWLRDGLLKDTPDYEGHKQRCNRAIINGFLSVLLVVAGSATCHILGSLAGLGNLGAVPWAVFYDFIVLAGVEEAAKFFMFKRALNKYPDHAFSWIELIIYMMCVGMGFELLESLEYAFGNGVGAMFMRGFTVMHTVFGFIMGYFYGKGCKTGNKLYFVLAGLIPWMFHGWFDFSINGTVNEIVEGFAYIGLALAAISFVLAIYIVFFFRKARNDEQFLVPVLQAKTEAELAETEVETGPEAGSETSGVEL